MPSVIAAEPARRESALIVGAADCVGAGVQLTDFLSGTTCVKGLKTADK
jgi:hypothetical protein